MGTVGALPADPARRQHPQGYWKGWQWRGARTRPPGKFAGRRESRAAQDGARDSRGRAGPVCALCDRQMSVSASFQEYFL